jgi:adenosine kinase
VPELRREFGGCAGNIAYNLRRIGGSGAPMGTVGRDFGPYADWLAMQNVSSEFVKEIPDAFTAQAYITTDLQDNQITAFHPGAMNHAHEQEVPTDAGITWGIISPDGRDGMLAHARQFAEAGIPFVFDPGQGLPMFDGEELKTFVEQAAVVTVNDYEGQMLMERTELTAYEIAERVDALVITRGGEGSVVLHRGKTIEIPAAKAPEVLDPTGCGDAFRAGLLFGLMAGADWQTTGRLASLMGAIKIGSHGTQNHSIDPESLRQGFEKNFGYDPGL